MNKASIQNTPVNMLVGSKILVHAMPIFYLQIYKNNDVACGPNFMLDEFSGNPLYFQSPLGEELNHPLLCLLLQLQQARRSTTGSGDKKSVSSLNGLLGTCISNCSLPFSKCSINLESLAVHCFFNCSFYFIDKYFCVVVKKT